MPFRNTLREARYTGAKGTAIKVIDKMLEFEIGPLDEGKNARVDVTWKINNKSALIRQLATQITKVINYEEYQKLKPNRFGIKTPWAEKKDQFRTLLAKKLLTHIADLECTYYEKSNNLGDAPQGAVIHHDITYGGAYVELEVKGKGIQFNRYVDQGELLTGGTYYTSANFPENSFVADEVATLIADAAQEAGLPGEIIRNEQLRGTKLMEMSAKI